MKTKVVIDFETRSECDLKKHGRLAYAIHPSTEILMCSYRYETFKNTMLWFPGEPLPDFFQHPQDYMIYAHNAEFEMAIWEYVGCRKYGFHIFDISDFTCLMALCGRYGLPQALDNVAKVLKLKNQKNPEGYYLIKEFCIPPFAECRGPKWEKFKQYCLEDTEAEFELMNTLPSDKLSPDERKNWEHSVFVNERGIPIDIENVKIIRSISEKYREANFAVLPDFTDGKITKITQTARIKDYINNQYRELNNVDYDIMTDCRANTVEEMLQRDDLAEESIMLLEMRAQLGLSSIGKYIRMEEMNIHGRIYDNQRYYGAHTGRWTGNGVQMLNLPRAKVKDPEAEIQKYHDKSILNENPVMSARALIRPMIKASEGKTLLVGDYSSIEYAVVEWLAGANHHLKRFADGFDQYIDQAAAMRNIPYEAVTPEDRQFGKIVILGCGFGQGADKLVLTTKQIWKIDITKADATFFVQGYRGAHSEVYQMWYAFKDAVVQAIQVPGTTITTNKVVFSVKKDRVGTPWLTIKLPSGRTLFYNRPSIKHDSYGPTPYFWGWAQTAKIWVEQRMIPGRITENIVQATARDILCQGMQECERMNFPVIWSVYDEVISEVEESKADLEAFTSAMCIRYPWMEGLPLRAEGFISKRYKKD